MTDLSKERQTVMGNDTRDIRIESNGYFEGKEVESNFIGFKINDLSIEVIPLQNNNGFLERATVNGNISETNYTWFQENQNIAIFTNLSRVKERLSKARVYRAYVYNDGACIRDFIPCYCTTQVKDVKNNNCVSGTIGMYDLVEGKFYTNQGNGTFLKGNDV